MRKPEARASAAIGCAVPLHNVADNRLASLAKRLRYEDLRTLVDREVWVIGSAMPQRLRGYTVPPNSC